MRAFQSSIERKHPGNEGSLFCLGKHNYPGCDREKNQFPAKIEKCHIMSHPQSITGSSFSGSFFIDVYFAFAAGGAQLHKLTLWNIVASDGICYDPCLQKNIASNLIEFS